MAFSVAQASVFVAKNGTSLERAAWRMVASLGGAPAAPWAGGDAGPTGGARVEALEALSRHQNPDGGWCRGIDPDYTGSTSSVCATVAGCRWLELLGGTGTEIAARTRTFLLARQRPDGAWDEDPDVARLTPPPPPKERDDESRPPLPDPPPWYASGSPATRLWLTTSLAAYAEALDLAPPDRVNAARVRVARDWFDSAHFPNGPLIFWMALRLFGSEDDSAVEGEVADEILRRSIGGIRNEIEWERLDLFDAAWVLETCHAVGFPISHPLVASCCERLLLGQEFDGGFVSLYGVKHRAAATLFGCAALSRYGLVKWEEAREAGAL
ncbi:MAG: terpene cyclase/mutase family protein [Planctomycetes bacterium]|nr:terpene cyclase/mutase family protein [Planctomycetota bacterium]